MKFGKYIRKKMIFFLFEKEKILFLYSQAIMNALLYCMTFAGPDDVHMREGAMDFKPNNL